MASAGGSFFSREIREVPLPERFKLQNIKTYEGKADLKDYLDHFNDLMELLMVLDLAKYRAFAVTLTNGAKKWFRSLATAKHFIHKDSFKRPSNSW